MPQLPQPLRWDHNAHYHRWLLHQLPLAPRNVLDVGCGAGGLAAKLAARAGHVDAVDVSAPMITRARTLYGPTGNIRWLVGDLLDPGLPLEHEGYDAVTAVSSLHHNPPSGGSRAWCALAESWPSSASTAGPHRPCSRGADPTGQRRGRYRARTLRTRR